MEIELKEVRDFITQTPPFNMLAEDVLDSLPRQTSIRYLRRGSVFPPADINETSLYIIRSGAIELRDNQDNLIGKLAEYDVYGEACRDNKSSSIIGHASEDCLLYTIPCVVIKPLCKQSDSFRNYFSGSVQQRLQQAIASTKSSVQAYSVLALEAGKLTDRAAVTVDVNSTIKQAAQLMSEENVSSILITENGNLVGVATDRDLRNRCIANGISRTQSIRQIMTPDPVTIGLTTSLSTALLEMTRRQIHHLPVMNKHIPVGNLSLSDIVRHLSTNPAFIASDINKSNSVDALIKLSQRLPELQLHLTNANANATQVGEVISSISDSLCQKLLQLAEAKLGPAPVPYVWLAAGSHARNEQSSHSDQDNALIIDDSMQPEHETYFEELANFVSDGLNACGYVYCPGNAMATNPQWRQPLKKWISCFLGWIERPEKKAIMLSSIFFDMRPIYGDSGLYKTLQENLLEHTQVNGIFIAYIVANALSHRPPLGFFRNFVLVHDGKHDNTLDIKHRGLAPIVDIARIYALSLGISATNTRERLIQARDKDSLSDEMCANLVDAFEFIGSLRMQHQARQIRKGEPPDNYLPPSSLSGLERGHLKDAFAVISDMQEVLENRYQIGRLI